MPLIRLSFFVLLITFTANLKAQGLFRKKDSIITQTLSQAWELDSKDYAQVVALSQEDPDSNWQRLLEESAEEGKKKKKRKRK